MTEQARIPLIIGNWKMNGTIGESLKLVTVLTQTLKAPVGCEVAVAPPFTALYSVGVTLQDTEYQLAAQDCFWENAGAYTSAISPAFLKDLDCNYVLIGHSERRQYFGETDETVNRKLDAALRADIKPVCCVGETLAQYEARETFAVIERQVKKGLVGISSRDMESVVFAYEPVWAIGTGKNAAPGHAAEVHAFIRNLLGKLYDSPTANLVRIIYGGSVKAANATELLREPQVDGLLVGGASLNGDQFAEIIRAVEIKAVPSM
jgi:triosephosphate isomerase